MKFKIDIESEWCKGCGICVAFCPKSVLALNQETEKAATEDASACIGCGTCERLCPDLAITVTPEGEN